MNLSIVMPVLGQIEMTKMSLESLCENTKNLLEVIIVNDGNGSDREEYDGLIFSFAKKYSNVRFTIENTREYGVTAAWNRGVSVCCGKYISIVNNDVLFSPNWDVSLIENLNKETWIVSPYHTRHNIPDDFPSGVYRHSNDLGILGCTFMFEKENWDEFGPIDERIKIWFNDNWLINRITKDFKKEIKEIESSYVHHLYSKTCNEKAKPGFVGQVKEDEVSFKKICEENNW